MPEVVVMGAMVSCSFGTTPASLTIVPPTNVTASLLPVATIEHHITGINIATFGECITESNPEVASATAAAMGVLVPMPCVPVTVTPWLPEAPTVLVAGSPILINTAICNCTWGGIITVDEPGQLLVNAL